MNLNCPKFELAAGYNDISLLPSRATSGSAGYDFVVAEDTIIPSYPKMLNNMKELTAWEEKLWNIKNVSSLTKQMKLKPTLVPTGVKAYIPKGQYLQLSVRSSCPLKNWLILANGVGIIDSDYYSNPDNDGEIFFQIINLFPQDILLQKGDKIGQGVFLNYIRTADDAVVDLRTGGFGSTDENLSTRPSK